MVRKRILAWWVFVGLGLLTACTTPVAVDILDVTPDGNPETVEVTSPPDRVSRGLRELNAIVHLHSAFSHDACDDEGLAEDGTPNWPCVESLKAALCGERIHVAFMTDHPSFMAGQPFSDLLYNQALKGTYRRGDDGQPSSVFFSCADVPGHTVSLVAGFEGTHTMGIGLQRHLTDLADYGISLKDSTEEAKVTRVVDAIHAAGGLVTIAHSEEDDISADLIASHDVDAMEIYNFHANFNEVLGNDLAVMILQLEAFLGPSDEAVPGDLAAFLMLGSYPEAALAKWRAVLGKRAITAIVGSDVHENVLIPALCADIDCSGIAEEHPHLAKFLEEGGPLVLSDGERIDSYARIFRWMQNRILVPATGDSLALAMEGLKAGRNTIVFTILGEPVRFDFVATNPTDLSQTHEMGTTVAQGSVLWVHTPAIPAAAEAFEPPLSAKVFRIDAAGAEEVAAFTTWDRWHQVVATTPGAYYVEVRQTPIHLKAQLQGLGELSNLAYRWIVTNPIHVE